MTIHCSTDGTVPRDVDHEVIITVSVCVNAKQRREPNGGRYNQGCCICNEMFAPRSRSDLSTSVRAVRFVSRGGNFASAKWRSWATRLDVVMILAAD
jgi:hypothetical protein